MSTCKHHNHKNFIEYACEKLKESTYKLTKSRIDVLETLENSEKALSPYQMQDLLKDQGKKYSAITIYRILETLLELKIIHKVHSINSYMKCCEEKNNHMHCLLVCKECHNVNIFERKEKQIPLKGFKKLEVIDEVLGICKNCK